jgi:hypothetical protein
LGSTHLEFEEKHIFRGGGEAASLKQRKVGITSMCSKKRLGGLGRAEKLTGVGQQCEDHGGSTHGQT